MARKPTGRPNGRPPKLVNLKQVEKLAGMMCTQEEIAAVLGVSVDTLTRREGFADSLLRGQNQGRASLRRAQFVSAMSGNSRMLTWMGMQFLNQRNKASNEISGPDGAPVQVQDLTKLSDDDLNALTNILAKTSESGSGESGTCQTKTE